MVKVKMMTETNDVDECLSDPCGPEQTCYDPNTSAESLGDFRCRCPMYSYGCVMQNSVLDLQNAVATNAVDSIRKVYSYTLSYTTVDECELLNPCNSRQTCVDLNTAGNSLDDFTCTCAADDYWCSAEIIYVDCWNFLSGVADYAKHCVGFVCYNSALRGGQVAWICFTEIHGYAPRLTNLFCGYVLFSATFTWFFGARMMQGRGNTTHNGFRASFVFLFARTFVMSLCQLHRLVYWLAAVLGRRFRGRRHLLEG